MLTWACIAFGKRIGFVAPVLALVLPLGSPVASASDDVWAAMKKPGRIVLMRHSYAPEEPSIEDDDNLKNCKTQRNLDDTGRAQARRTGDEFRKRGIKSARIYSSQYCRSLETARLLKLGSVTELAVLNLSVYGRPVDMRETAEKARAFMRKLSRKELVLLVTHVANIHALAGVAVASGEMAVVTLSGSGDVVLDGRILVK
jgi:phosphohistidine phosphatase SixA